MSRIRRTGVALATVLALSACASGQQEPGDLFSGDAQADAIQIEIRNLNFSDATVHALRGTERVRLGIVTGKTDRTFSLSWQFDQPLQLEIDLLAGESCRTRALNVSPGETLELQIPSVLNRMDCV